MEISGLRLNITIGEHEVYRAPRWWIDSQRSFPLGRAGVILPDPERDLYKSIKRGDAVEITCGYRDRDPAVWRGSVLYCGPGETKDQIEVSAVDGSLPLAAIRVTQSWENETPEAIIKWAVNKAGLTIGRIDAPGIVLPRFIASNIPVWQVARQAAHSCQAAFEIDMSRWAFWLGASGVNWGDFDEVGEAPVITTGDGLISHSPAEGPAALSMIETFLLPELTHSRQVHLQDNWRGIDERFRALRVKHEGTPDTARTFIWYGTESE